MHRFTKEESRRGARALNRILARNDKLEEKRIRNILKTTKSEKYRKNMHNLFLDYFKKPGNRKHVSLGLLKYYRNSENRKKHHLALLEYYKTNFSREMGKEDSRRMKRFWANKENRNKLSRKMKKMYQTSYYKNKIDRAVTRWWNDHPNIKKERSIELKRFFLEHPQEFKKKFMNGKNNPFKPHLKTAFGLVRSLGEQQIADYLAGRKIRAEYETKVLNLDGWICVPDFWLPRYKYYIEYYGGYPGSWKKKVLKNKMYFYHSVRTY